MSHRFGEDRWPPRAPDSDMTWVGPMIIGLFVGVFAFLALM